MKISGYKDEENKKLIIEIEYDEEPEIVAFENYFQNMLEKMMRDHGGAMVDVLNNHIITSDGVEEADQQQINNLIRNHIMEVSNQFKNNFLLG